MINKKPRIPSPVQIPEHLSFLQGFRDYLVAQTVSPHTRNAYLSDLIQCSELHKKIDCQIGRAMTFLTSSLNLPK
ncbi:hypothetical protein DU202_00285 [Acinetobacter baumannii DU202]|nr:hypothetical protein DU202_00285 [Acinetobacter baumannii DU202]